MEDNGEHDESNTEIYRDSRGSACAREIASDFFERRITRLERRVQEI